jgi:hypothetical protein
MKGDIEHFSVVRDGSSIVATSDGTCLAADFSKASGADGMLVMAGPGAPSGESVAAGATTFSFKFLTAGEVPKPRAEGNRVLVGSQTVSLEDGRIVLGKTDGPWKGPTPAALEAITD